MAVLQPRPVDPLPSTAHVYRAMLAVLKRLLTLCLALAFLLGVTAQLMPSSMAETQMTVSADMAGNCAAPQAPCTGHMPNCVDHVGCVTLPALPASPTSM